jgi:hypothetical protein
MATTKRTPKRLPQSDVEEIVKFQSYLADLRGQITPSEFAAKWHEYMGITQGLAEVYVELVRGAR